MFNPVNNCSIILVLFLITSFHSFQVTWDFEIPCNASTPTIAMVPFCPNNTQTYKEAADKKNCSAIPHMCESFVYYCVRNKGKKMRWSNYVHHISTLSVMKKFNHSLRSQAYSQIYLDHFKWKCSNSIFLTIEAINHKNWNNFLRFFTKKKSFSLM